MIFIPDAKYLHLCWSNVGLKREEKETKKCLVFESKYGAIYDHNV